MNTGSSAENVSRETTDRLRHFEALVEKWTKKINLVSKGDIPHIWDRHIVDSLQVYDVAPEEGDWLDIGSGGGFPGVVAAIVAKERQPVRKFTLIDSDQRKCAFLRTAARELDLNVTVTDARVEALAPQGAQVLSARALDDLTGLLAHAELHLSQDGVALFPKGSRWRQEHEAAKAVWNYDLAAVPSQTNPDAVILKIKELSRV